MLNVKIANGDSIELIQSLPDESVDLILTDPPYLYLDLKWDVPFDEDVLFNHYYRVLKNNSCIVIFGRGISMARWLVKLDSLGVTFKEEIVWDKGRGVNFNNPVPRAHEMAYILVKGKRSLNKQNVPYSDPDQNLDLKKIKDALNSIKRGLKDPTKLAQLEYYLETGFTYKKEDPILEVVNTQGAAVREGFKRYSYRSTDDLKRLVEGLKLTSVIKDTSIFGVSGNKKIHPTQKPTKLLGYLIEMCSNEGDLILDTFMGSGSVGIAAIERGRHYVGYELDDSYYNLTTKRFTDFIEESGIDVNFES